MALIAQGMAAAFGIQTGGFGAANINTTIENLTGSLTLASGIVLGDASTGIAKSGITLAFANEKREVADVPGFFTKQFATWLRDVVSKFSITVQWAGNRHNCTATPISGDFAHDDVSTHYYPGFDALHRCAGLLGATSAGAPAPTVAWVYSPADVLPITAKVWFGTGTETIAFVIYDIVGNLTHKITGGDVVLGTFDMEGKIHSRTKAVTFPTFDFGVAASVSAPKVESAGHSWGISSTVRSFSDATLKITNKLTEFSDANAEGGKTTMQEGREITLESTLFTISDNESYDLDRLASSTATTDDVLFSVGSAALGGAPALGFQYKFNNPDHATVEPTTIAGKSAVKAKATATSTAGNGEFMLIYY